MNIKQRDSNFFLKKTRKHKHKNIKHRFKQEKRTKTDLTYPIVS